MLTKISYGLFACVLGMSSTITYAQIEEVVVTAERRAESIQDVPISITAFSEEGIEKMRIQDFGDLGNKIPGFGSVSFSKSRFTPAIRGGSSLLNGPGADAAVGLYIDDTYFSGPGDFEVDLFDIERIEVLHGPQGTLFGRNTTAGAVNVVTKDPAEEFEGKFEATLGDYEMLQLRGYLSGPLTDDKRASVAFSSTNRDGTSFNSVTGNDVDDIGRTSVRGKFVWDINDTLEAKVGFGYNSIDETGVARDFVMFGPFIPFDNQDPGLAGFVPDGDTRTVQQFNDGGYRLTQYTASLHLTKELSDASLMSITTYRDMETEEDPNSLAGAPIPIFSLAEPRDVRTITQEVRYISEYEGKFNWVGGLYFLSSDESRDGRYETYWEENTRFSGFQTFLFGCSDPVAGPGGGFIGGGAADPGFLPDPACVASDPSLYTPNNFRVYQETETTSIAVFAQGSYDVTDTITATAGGRYTYDRKEANGFSEGDPDFFWNNFRTSGEAPNIPVGTTAKDSWEEFTWRVALDWQATDDVLMYGSVSTGYRSGAFDYLTISAFLGTDSLTTAVEPETVTSYEVGFKSRFWDNRVQLNVAAFRVEYDDLQFFINFGDGGLNTNAGEQIVEGVELEFDLALTDELTFSLGYAYQDGEINGAISPIDGTQLVPEGEVPGQTPEHTVILGLDYVKLTSRGEFFGRADFTHKSRHFLELERPPQFQSETEALVNLNAGFTFNNNVTISAWVKNVTNEDIVLHGQGFWGSFWAASTTVPGQEYLTLSAQPRYAPPRTWGVTVGYEF
ncbi:MAG: TonB-dependent receptor plug domain-containing protein [Gammaproteobacteria bacterium]|nr:TonB-dependent receptor plug domain-containing protein [Gammaproteobacteria bacterium]